MQVSFLIVVIKKYIASIEKFLVKQLGSRSSWYICLHFSSHSDTTSTLSVLLSEDMGIGKKQFVLTVDY
jgi:hypothetical protein